MEPINENPFEHTCRNGTVFTAKRCDFLGGVAFRDESANEALFLQDLSEMIGFHACNIHPRLNGFQGYDCVNFVREEGRSETEVDRMFRQKEKVVKSGVGMAQAAATLVLAEVVDRHFRMVIDFIDGDGDDGSEGEES